MAKKRQTKRSAAAFALTLIAAICALVLAYFRPDLLETLLGNETKAPQTFLPQGDRSEELDGKLQTHFIDVGQGDATLFITPSGKTLLIDAGPNSAQDRLVSYLKATKIKQIDCILFTHPHEDHIGGGDAVIEAFPVGRILMPDYESSSSTFERLITLIDQKEIPVTLTEAGDTITLSELTLEIFGPITMPIDDANNASVVFRAKYGETAYLFSGDAEKKSEKEVLSHYQDRLAADVYHVAHHGSNTSSYEDFVKAIAPRIAVISCGVDNEYNHPNKEPVELLLSMGVTLYRTDLQGSILLLSDGKTVT